MLDPKENIIKSAVDLFCKKGYEGTSVRRIANAAGVNVAMINYYFGSKEKLLEKVIEDKLSFLRNIFTELVKNKLMTSIEKIETIIDLVIERKFSNRQFNKLLHRELSLEHRPQFKSTITSLLMLNITPIKQIIREGIQSGEFKKIDVEMTVASITGTVHYLLISEEMSRSILDKKSDFNPYSSKQLKKRVKEHTKQLIRAHLLKKPGN